MHVKVKIPRRQVPPAEPVALLACFTIVICFRFLFFFYFWRTHMWCGAHGRGKKGQRIQFSSCVSNAKRASLPTSQPSKSRCLMNDREKRSSSSFRRRFHNVLTRKLAQHGAQPTSCSAYSSLLEGPPPPASAMKGL